MKDLKLDRTSFEITTFIKADDDAIHWKDKTPNERLEYSMILNAVCYGFLNSELPKMDKSYFRIVKSEELENLLDAESSTSPDKV